MNNSGKVFLIYNWHCEDNHWIPQKFEERNYQVSIIDVPQHEENNRGTRTYRIHNFFTCMHLAKKATKMAKDEDIIISLTSTPGICCALYSLAGHSKVNILALNMLANWGSANIMIEKCRDLVYRLAFKYNSLWTTTNSQADLVQYSRKLGIPRNRISWLPDTIEEINEGTRSTKKKTSSEYVFSGGISERDWDAIIYCAQKRPDITFVIAASKKYWSERYPNLKNVHVYFDISSQKFNQLLEGCKIVLLPLKSFGTAGLIVLFEALRNAQIFIATDTEAIRNFVEPGLASQVLYPMGDYDALLKQLEKWWKAEEPEKNKNIKSLIGYIYKNYSEEEYMNKLEKILDQMKNDRKY